MLLEEMEAEFSESQSGGSSSGGRVTQKVSLNDPSALDSLKSWGVSVS